MDVSPVWTPTRSWSAPSVGGSGSAQDASAAPPPSVPASAAGVPSGTAASVTTPSVTAAELSTVRDAMVAALGSVVTLLPTLRFLPA